MTDLRNRNANLFREILYDLLSRSYSEEVNEEHLAALITNIPHIESLALDSNNELFKKGKELLSRFLDDIDWGIEEMKDLLLELARDFCYFFLTGVNSVPTSESVYLSPEKLVKQEPRNQVLKMYRQIGFNISGDCKEPEDHIALELKFMARISHLMGEALDTGDRRGALTLLDFQKRFIEEHLNIWIPLFCNFLTKAAKKKESIFYAAIAYLTEGFIISDYKSLTEYNTRYTTFLHGK